MHVMFLWDGVAQEGPYEVLPPDEMIPDAERRRYPDGKIGVFRPVLACMRSFAEETWYEFSGDDPEYDKFLGLPEPIRVARQGVLDALEALMAACDSHASSS